MKILIYKVLLIQVLFVQQSLNYATDIQPNDNIEFIQISRIYIDISASDYLGCNIQIRESLNYTIKNPPLKPYVLERQLDFNIKEI